MLGRKAILHNSRQGKRKWQLEQERDDDDGGSETSHDGQRSDHEAALGAVAAPPGAAAPPEAKGGGEADEPMPRALGKVGEEEEDDDDDEEGEDAEDGAKKKKRFAWMDSDDELSGGDDEDVEAAGNARRSDGNSAAQEAPTPVARPGGGGGAAAARPAAQPPAALLPSTHLPNLTQAHVNLMVHISTLRTLNDLWDLVDKQGDTFAASHASTSLYRVSLLSMTSIGATSDTKFDNNKSFVRLCERVDELLATPEGRASFLPADLAMVVSALAKVVQAPAKEGAVGRIFADIADEAETRISTEPRAFTPPMLGDLAWGVSKSEGEPAPGGIKTLPSPAIRRFFGTIIQAAKPRLCEMTCQDLANLSAAFADTVREDADELLRGIFEQTRIRLAYQPQPTNALFGGPGVVTTPGVMRPPGSALVADPAQPPQELAVKADDTSKPQTNALPPWQVHGQWKFNGAQICEVTAAVAKHINLYEVELFDLVAKQFLTRLQEFTTAQLQRLQTSFDVVRHDREIGFLRAMRTALKQREGRRAFPTF